MIDSKEKSLIFIAEEIVKDLSEPINIYDLFDKVSEVKGYTNTQKAAYISQFYADLTTSAKFSYVGDNNWDLKYKQKVELWDKDGSFYNEYTEVHYDGEIEPKKKPRKRAAKKKPAVKKVVKEAVVEEIAVVEEVKPEVVEEIKTPEVKPEVAVVETETDETDKSVFDEFDEDKYNEYMDTYEDRYDKKK